MLLMTPDLTTVQLKTRIAWTVGMLLAAVLGITGWQIWSDRASVLAASELQAQGYVRALEEHAGSALAEADRALREVVNGIRVRGGVGRLDRSALYRLLRRQGGDTPQIGSIFLADRAGTMFVNSLEYPPKPIDVADRGYFRYDRGHPDAGLYISRPLVSRLVNRWRFTLARPLTGQDGRFEGLAAVAFEIDYFDRFYHSLQLGPGGTISLVRIDGAPVVAVPVSDAALTADLRNTSLFREHLGRELAGVFIDQSGDGGRAPRLVAYRRLSRLPLVAVVSLDRDDILLPWRQKAYYEATMTVGLCLAILVMTALLFRHLEQLEEAQASLREQEEMVRIKAAQIDAANDAIVLLASDGRLVQCNSAFSEMTGYGRDELLRMQLCDLAPSGEGPACDRGFGAILSRRDATVETALRTRTGGELPVEVHARAMESDDGSRILAIIRDIGERKRSELRERSRLQILEEMATGGALPAILDRIVRFVEQESDGTRCAILLENITGELLTVGAAPGLPGLDNALAGGVPVTEPPASDWHRRTIVEELSGDPFWGEIGLLRIAELRSCLLEPVLSSQGELMGTIAVFHRQPGAPDETEIRLIESAAHLANIAIERFCAESDRKLLEEQLHHVQRIEAVGQLAGGIAHDFNNLLTPILCYADLILLKTPPADPMTEKVGAIIRAAQKARDLTQQLLSFGRKQTLIIRTLDLNGIIGGFRDILRRTIRENIAIDLRLAPGGLAIRADQGQIEQILLNLAVNAQDAIRGNGVITIESGHIVMDSEYVRLHPGLQPGPYALLSLSDNGSGMDDTTLAHIFEPFFTTKQIGHGTGLGLATVYGIIKQHEGAVTVRSSVGKGTTFCIYLPLSDEPLPRAEAPAEPVPVPSGAGAGQTVLVSEDNEMVRTMIVEVLETAGYRVLSAAAPSAALELVRRAGGGIALLVSDVVMPEMGGQELYEELLEVLPELRVLYISGYANELFAHNGLLEEEVNFLQKPFSTERLLARVHQLVGGCRMKGGESGVADPPAGVV